jgi:hypothetical protein
VHRGNVLACLSKEWWSITAVVVTDAPMDVTSPASSRTAVVVTHELLLKRRARLHQLLLLLLELPL